MPADFITMVTRITTEIRRTNLTVEVKNAINDAIDEASKHRFYFNEMRGVTFNTVANQEYYSDAGVVEIDTIYYFQNGARQNIYLDNNIDADERAAGNIVGGQLTNYSRQGTDIRLYPRPSVVTAVFIDGYGKLTPYPLVNNADTNNWMTYGERYIRALAKSILMKEVIRDYGEAAALEAIAEDYKSTLIDETTKRLGTGVIQGTQW